MIDKYAFRKNNKIKHLRTKISLQIDNRKLGCIINLIYFIRF